MSKLVLVLSEYSNNPCYVFINPLRTDSELEIKLRYNTTKVKVVRSLPHGTNILLPNSVAVRIYNSSTIENMEKEHSNRIRESLHNRINKVFRKNNDIQLGENHGCDDDNLVEPHGIDFDGICSFRDSFRHSVVCFILSNDELVLSQLGRYDSIVNTLQRCLSDKTTSREKVSEIYGLQSIDY